MQRYSHFFSTVYDQQQSVGELGRGTHYSVLRAVLWESGPMFHDIAVIWDEDHDLRVIWVIEQMHVKGLLAPVLAIGERKGGITVLTNSAPTKRYCQQIEEIASLLPSDSFSATVEVFTEASSMIIHADEARVRGYLVGIHALWSLGSKSPEFTTAPFHKASSSNLEHLIK